MTEGVKLIFWIAGVHILGLACVAVLLLPALRDESASQRGNDETDEGWGGGPRTPPSRPKPPTGGIPLPDSSPAGVRLRAHGRLADKLPARQRRPVREPARPAPVGDR